MSRIDARELRSAFGAFITGVTVVTTRDADGSPVGFTANSFSSVSLEPPLLLVCPGRFLSSFEVFRNCSHFAVSVLAEGQEQVSNIFAGFKGDRFAQIPHEAGENGVPVISGAAASFSCTTEQVIPAGDHCILMGRVDRFSHSAKRGLGYSSGRYFSLGMERAAAEEPGARQIAGVIVECEGDVLLRKVDGKYRPMQIELDGSVPVRTALTDHLAASGLNATLGRVYSIFSERNGGRRHCYLLAGAKGSGFPGCERVPASRLCELDYDSPALRDMMIRYGLETQTGNFSLYIGDDQQGDIHSQD